MSRKSCIEQGKKLKRLSAKYAPLREECKKKIRYAALVASRERDEMQNGDRVIDTASGASKPRAEMQNGERVIDAVSAGLQMRNAMEKLQELPRGSSKTRYRNRGPYGYPRAYDSYFHMDRHTLRSLASKGLLPGVSTR